ncbi:CoA-binding protein [Streptococcus catagoni]|uniref:CoA-binding protein n=1 Tax=Streptococcus catagoni TaxID=2654874 RepID=UPI0014074E94|nr:CoA-binding protein [Streptococcus catagoni]
MTYTFQNPDQTTIKEYLKQAKIIAVVGLSDRQDTAAFRVSAFLKDKGYRIIPVNPRLEGQEILGEEVYASLKDIPFTVDIVDVFRRSEALPQVAEDFIQTDAKVFWAQLGLENQEAESILRAAGCDAIVMNRCLKIDYNNLLLS